MEGLGRTRGTALTRLTAVARIYVCHFAANERFRPDYNLYALVIHRHFGGYENAILEAFSLCRCWLARKLPPEPDFLSPGASVPTDWPVALAPVSELRFEIAESDRARKSCNSIN
jgi:hypothetical protein